MRFTIRLKFDAAQRALAFCRDRPDPNPAAAPSVARLGQLLDEAAAQEAAQARCRNAAAAARTERDHYLERIRNRASDLVHLASSAAVQEGIVALNLRLPMRRGTRLGFIAEVRHTLTVARGHEELLCRYGLPVSLLGNLEADLISYEAAEQCGAGHDAERIESTGTLAALGLEAHKLIRHLDALNRIRFSDNPAAADAWRAARAVQWPGAGVAPARPLVGRLAARPDAAVAPARLSSDAWPQGRTRQSPLRASRRTPGRKAGRGSRPCAPFVGRLAARDR